MSEQLHQCTSCRLADVACPSFPHPSGECKQRQEHPEADRWWQHLHEPELEDVDGD